MSNPPAYLGRYLLEEEIGRGGAGTVWRAHDPLLQRVVAIKILSRHPIEDEHNHTQRFLAEARAIARLVHHNIVVLYDYGTDSGHQWLAMQMVQGYSLAKVVSHEGTLSVARTLDVARQILRALRYAHSQHVVHRDVKSSNILLDEGTGTSFLGDFGIALLENTERLTTEGVALGTPEYMSPEQCQGLPLDERSDIYSLGVVLHECLAGKPPFLADAPLAIAYKHVHEAPPDLGRDDVPQALKQILRKAMAKRPEDRFASAAAMLEALDTLIERPRTPSRGVPAFTVADQRATPDRRNNDRRRGPRRGHEPVEHPLWYTQPLVWIGIGVLFCAFVTMAMVAWFVLHYTR